MKLVVLLNDAAGTSAAGGIADESLRGAFAPFDVHLQIVRAVGAELEQAAQQAAKGDADVIVAAGGDGTISTVARVVIDSGKTLGVLPVGTLNHFAKALGMPLDLAAAAAVVCGGNERRVDVGQVNGQIFLNNSSIGIYPAMVRNRDEQRLRWGRNKWWAMLIASLRVFRRFPLLHVRLHTSSHQLVSKTPFVFVGNNAYQINLLSLGARSCLDAGQLSLYIAHCRTRWALVRLLWRTLCGTLNQATDFDILCATELTVENRKHHLSVALDGEVLQMTPPLKFVIRPRALRVLAPAVAATSP